MDTNVDIIIEETTPEEDKPEKEENIKLSTQDMLENVNSAIMAITVGGQSYKIGSRSLTRADLKQLYALRKDLMAEAQAETGNTGFFEDCYVAIFDRR